MLIYKVLNNNAVISRDEYDREIIVTGKGLAFQKGMYDQIDETLITKIYSPKDKYQKNRLKELVSEIPYEYFVIVEKIVAYAKKKLDCELEEGLLIRLTDHIHYAVKKTKKDINTPNLMLNEIRQFYAKEYAISKQAVKVINKHFKSDLDDNEAGFIAFHIVSCEDQNGLIDINDMLMKMQRIVSAIEDYFNITFDIESLNYARFIVHLKFFMRKMIMSKSQDEKSLSGDSLFSMLMDKYQDINQCLNKINAITLLDYNYKLSDSDRMYLIIHLARLLNTDL